MLYADSNYKSVPDLLAAFAKQFKTEHFHIHGGWHHNSAEDTLLSVFKDDTNQLHQGARLAFKGSLIGLVTGLSYNWQYGGRENQFFHTRSILKKVSRNRTLPSFAVIGALGGLSWWIIHDLFLCPHGKQISINRYVLAHALQGGLVIGALYHPSAIVYGMALGAATGLFRDSLTQHKLPKNFQIYFKNFDEEKRRNKLRDDEEWELSLRSVIRGSHKVFHPI